MTTPSPEVVAEIRRVRRILHERWSGAVGTDGYDKSWWMDAERTVWICKTIDAVRAVEAAILAQPAPNVLGELAQRIAACSTWSGLAPDLAEPGTRGVLVALVRLLWRDPYAHVVPVIDRDHRKALRYRWCCKTALPQGAESSPVRTRLVDHVHDEEGGALALAWLDGVKRFGDGS